MAGKPPRKYWLNNISLDANWQEEMVQMTRAKGDDGSKRGRGAILDIDRIIAIVFLATCDDFYGRTLFHKLISVRRTFPTYYPSEAKTATYLAFRPYSREKYTGITQFGMTNRARNHITAAYRKGIEDVEGNRMYLSRNTFHLFLWLPIVCFDQKVRNWDRIIHCPSIPKHYKNILRDENYGYKFERKLPVKDKILMQGKSRIPPSTEMRTPIGIYRRLDLKSSKPPDIDKFIEFLKLSQAPLVTHDHSYKGWDIRFGCPDLINAYLGKVKDDAFQKEAHKIIRGKITTPTGRLILSKDISNIIKEASIYIAPAEYSIFISRIHENFGCKRNIFTKTGQINIQKYECCSWIVRGSMIETVHTLWSPILRRLYDGKPNIACIMDRKGQA